MIHKNITTHKGEKYFKRFRLWTPLLHIHIGICSTCIHHHIYYLNITPNRKATKHFIHTKYVISIQYMYVHMHNFHHTKNRNMWSYLWLKECSLLYLVSIKKKFQFFPIFFNIYCYVDTYCSHISSDNIFVWIAFAYWMKNYSP